MHKSMAMAVATLSTVFSLSSCTDERIHANTALATEATIEQLATDFLDDSRIHSVSIAVVDRGTQYSLHYGEQTPGLGNPPTDETLYELASVTKTFTGTMAARAVLEGKISLDDDIRDYLDDGYTNLLLNDAPITVQHLLTHTGGFPNFPPTMENKRAFLDALSELELSKPGNRYRYRYSNTAPEITAYILEQVYATPYQMLVHRELLEPSGMTDTHFGLSEDEQRRLIQGYNEQGEAQDHFQNELWGGIAGIHSTTLDLLKYIQYHLDESDPVVKESHRYLSSTPFDFDIGYHWNIVEQGDQRYYRHHGGIWGMQNWLMIYPSDQIGIAVLSNASFDGIDSELADLATGIHQHLIESR